MSLGAQELLEADGEVVVILRSPRQPHEQILEGEEEVRLIVQQILQALGCSALVIAGQRNIRGEGGPVVAGIGIAVRT